MCVGPLGTGRMYIDRWWVAKKIDGGKDCKLVPNVHSSLLPQSQKLHLETWLLDL